MYTINVHFFLTEERERNRYSTDGCAECIFLIFSFSEGCDI